MKFVYLENVHGKVVAINPEHVTSIVPSGAAPKKEGDPEQVFVRTVDGDRHVISLVGGVAGVARTLIGVAS